MTEKCGRCERPAPPPIEGPDGQVEQGWVTYEGARELVVAVPDDSSLLPPNVVATMRAFEGELIRIAPWPDLTVAAVQEVNSSFIGIACPDCQRETGWDYAEWCWHFAQQEKPPYEE